MCFLCEPCTAAAAVLAVVCFEPKIDPSVTRTRLSLRNAHNTIPQDAETRGKKVKMKSFEATNKSKRKRERERERWRHTETRCVTSRSSRFVVVWLVVAVLVGSLASPFASLWHLRNMDAISVHE